MWPEQARRWRCDLNNSKARSNRAGKIEFRDAQSIVQRSGIRIKTQRVSAFWAVDFPSVTPQASIEDEGREGPNAESATSDGYVRCHSVMVASDPEHWFCRHIHGGYVHVIFAVLWIQGPNYYAAVPSRRQTVHYFDCPRARLSPPHLTRSHPRSFVYSKVSSFEAKFSLSCCAAHLLSARRASSHYLASFNFVTLSRVAHTRFFINMACPSLMRSAAGDCLLRVFAHLRRSSVCCRKFPPAFDVSSATKRWSTVNHTSANGWAQLAQLNE